MSRSNQSLSAFSTSAKIGCSYLRRLASSPRRSILCFAFALTSGHCGSAFAAAPSSLLLLTQAGGIATSTVQFGVPVALTAAATAAGVPLTRGQVAFCDAAGPRCNGTHLLGIGQLRANGTARLVVRPTNGRHTFYAKLIGTMLYDGSQSGAASLNVTSTYYSFPSITATRQGGSFTLTSRVFGQGTVAPTGTVRFTSTTGATANTTLLPGKPAIGLVSNTLPAARNLETLPHLESGDFNNDGLTDLVASSNDGVAIYLSNGDGSFSLQPIVSTRYYNFALATGDFNADGNTDILSSNGVFAHYTVLLGRGDGTFEEKQTVAAASPDNVEFRVADFNRDGVLDVRAGLTYLMGNGDGTFGEPQVGAVYPDTSATPVAVTTADAIIDLNGDGINDRVHADGTSGYTVSLCGQTGECTSKTYMPSIGSADVVSSADLNDDGTPDLVVARKRISSTSADLQVLFGRGDGTFRDGPQRRFSAITQGLLIGDFNNDGLADLLTLGEQGIGGGATFLFGNGDGTFLLDEAYLQSGDFSPVPGRFLQNGLLSFANQRQYGDVWVTLSSLSYVSSATFTGTLPEQAGASFRAEYLGDTVYLPSQSGSVRLPD